MSKIWRWIFGIVIGLALLGLVIFGSPNRQAYHTAKGRLNSRVNITPGKY